MTIEQLDSEKVLISLCSEDMRDYSLSFDTLGVYDEHSRKVLLRLLRLAFNKTGMNFGSKSVLMEALPHQSGCLILVTLIDKEPKRKTYRVKRIETKPCFCFQGAEELLCSLEILRDRGIALHRNSLWLYKDRYCLVFDYPVVPQRARQVLSEYAESIELSSLQIARMKESGKILCGFNAVEIIGSRI